MPSSARTVRLNDKVSDAVDEIARICGRDANFIMRDAIEEYVAHHDWIIRETETRLAKAKSGEASLVSHNEVEDSILQRVQKKQ